MKQRKPILAFEVHKDNCMNFEDTGEVGLRVELALNGGRRMALESMGKRTTLEK